MRTRHALAFLPFAGLALVWACSSDSSSNPGSPSDASVDTAGDVVRDASDGGPIPPDDVVISRCTLPDQTDPVALCAQKQVLQSVMQAAYVPGKGVAPTWDAVTGMVGTGHAWQDDVGFAAAIGMYHCSSGVYGDNEITASLDAILPDLAKTITAELTPLPPGYDGEAYFQLRMAQAAFYYANDNADGDATKAIADAYGRRLQTYAHVVAGVGPAPGDGGADAGSDAGTTPPGIVLGTPDGNGNVAYAPAQTVMAAAALLDMAVAHGSDPDAGSDPETWEATALGALDYVWKRARDPQTGLFYQSLVTSGDAAHDALGQGTPSGDALLTDVQAAILLGLARAQDGVNALKTADAGLPDAQLPQFVYWDESNTLLTAMNAAALFDGVSNPPTPPPPGAYMEGLIPSAAATMTNKTTLGNAWLLGGFHREAVGLGSNQAGVLGQVRSALLQALPGHSSLFSVVTDMNGSPVQQAYLRASTKDWHYAVTFGADGGAGGPEPGATSYRTDASNAMIEGMTQLWHGRPSAPPCSL